MTTTAREVRCRRRPRRAIPSAAAALVLVLATGPLSAAENEILWPFSNLGKNTLAAFSGSNALVHLSAAAGTFLIVKTGLDTKVHNLFARDRTLDRYSHPAVALGSYFPAILGGGLFASGLVGGGSKLASAGSAVLQASLLAIGTTVTLKALTGRPGPDPVVYADNSASNVFRFGILRGGVWHGWPSGHMLTNVAAVTSLMSFYRDNTLLNIAGGASLGYLFLSVISHGRATMHWFSDAVAGTLMGWAIGTTVGREFRRSFDGTVAKPAGVSANVLFGRVAFTIAVEI